MILKRFDTTNSGIKDIHQPTLKAFSGAGSITMDSAAMRYISFKDDFGIVFFHDIRDVNCILLKIENSILAIKPRRIRGGMAISIPCPEVVKILLPREPYSESRPISRKFAIDKPQEIEGIIYHRIINLTLQP